MQVAWASYHPTAVLSLAISRLCRVSYKPPYLGPYLFEVTLRLSTTTVSVMTERNYLPPPLDEMKHVTCICHLAWPVALFLVVRSVRIVTTTIVIILQWVANPQNFCSLP